MTTNNLFWLFLVMGLVLTASSYAQETTPDGHFEIKETKNGPIRVWVPDTPEAKRISESHRAVTTSARMDRTGMTAIMDQLGISDIESLMEIELAEYQSKDLKAIINECKRKRGSVIGQKENTDLKLEYARKVRDVLLPEQLKAIATRANPEKRLFSLMILATKSQLRITDQQKKQLVSECDSAHKQIEDAIAEIEEKKRECRERMLEIYNKVLTDSQKEQFSKKLSINDLLNEMSLRDMEADTDTTIAKER